jgi:hypothetical protein
MTFNLHHLAFMSWYAKVPNVGGSFPGWGGENPKLLQTNAMIRHVNATMTELSGAILQQPCFQENVKIILDRKSAPRHLTVYHFQDVLKNPRNAHPFACLKWIYENSCVRVYAHLPDGKIPRIAFLKEGAPRFDERSVLSIYGYVSTLAGMAAKNEYSKAWKSAIENANKNPHYGAHL